MLIPGYKIFDVLGEGGMATVYRAQQESLGREVAVKIMSEELINSDKSFCDRFLKEGKIIAKLRHEHIVTIYDIGCTTDNLYYMSMEYCNGGTLKERIRSPDGVSDPITITKHIARALGYAHDKGFVHRDIKPGNVLFRDDGSAVLSDFGIAKTMDDRTQLTQSGLAIGTPEYMSPEQAVGSKLDGRSDLYSLGIVLYEMLVGKKPFVGDDAVSTALMQLQKPVPRLPSQHSRMQHIIDGLMAKNASDRFQTSDELIEELDSLRRSAAAQHSHGDATRTFVVSTKDVPSPTRIKTHQQDDTSSFKKWAAIAGATLVAVVGIWLGIRSVGNDETPQTKTTVVTDQQLPENKTQDKVETVDNNRLDDVELTESQRKLNRLLSIARAHMAVGRLRNPVGSNAFEAYSLVLELDPGNREAKEALAEIDRTPPN